MSYKTHHHYNKTEGSANNSSAIIIGLKRIFLTPISSVIFISTIAFTITAATSFYILRLNLNALDSRWNESAEISLYLKKPVGLTEATNLREKISSNNLAATVILVQPTEGMKYFAENTTLKTIISNLKENPLPQVIIIHPKIKLLAENSENTVTKFIDLLKTYPEVDVVKANIAWIEHSINLVNLLDNLSMFFILLLGLNALLTIYGGSYILTQILTTKDASNATIQYQFAWYGLIGSIFALLLIRLVSISIQNHTVCWQGLDTNYGILVLLTSSLLGMIGAKMAMVAKNL